MALVATWHLSVPVLTCGTEVHLPPPPYVWIGRDIWQVAFKSLPLGNTASLTGLLKALTWLASRKREERRESPAVLPYRSVSLPPSLHTFSSIFRVLCKVSTLQPSTFNTSNACLPAYISNWVSKKKRTTGEVRRRWQRVTIKIATWWPDACCSHLSPFSPSVSPIVLKQTENSNSIPHLKIRSSVFSLIQANLL